MSKHIIIPSNYHPSWDGLFKKESTGALLDEIANKLPAQYYPDAENVLRFTTVDANKIKCVIIGMDPYASDYARENKTLPVATGRSFEVASVDSWQQKFKQASLRNILKGIYYNQTGDVVSIGDVRSKILLGEFPIAEPNSWFDQMEKSGVLFLNASLTVAPADSGSHLDLWFPFTRLVMEYIDKKGMYWMLWGDNAREIAAPAIHEGISIESCHPRKPEFVKQNPFGLVKTIDWLGTRE